MTEAQYHVGIQIADIWTILEIKRIVTGVDKWEGCSRKKEHSAIIGSEESHVWGKAIDAIQDTWERKD